MRGRLQLTFWCVTRLWGKANGHRKRNREADGRKTCTAHDSSNSLVQFALTQKFIESLVGMLTSPDKFWSHGAWVSSKLLQGGITARHEPWHQRLRCCNSATWRQGFTGPRGTMLDLFCLGHRCAWSTLAQVVATGFVETIPWTLFPVLRPHLCSRDSSR